VLDWVHLKYFILSLYFKHSGMSYTKKKKWINVLLPCTFVTVVIGCYQWGVLLQQQASRHVAVSHSPAASVDLVRLCNGVFSIAPFSLQHLRVSLHPEPLNKWFGGRSARGHFIWLTCVKRSPYWSQIWSSRID